MPRTPAPDARDRARRLAGDPDAAPWSPVRSPEPRRASEADRPEAAGPEIVVPAAVEPGDAPSEPWEPGDAGPGDAADVAARFRAGALGAVAAAYTTAHGHPVGADLEEARGPRRWAVSARAAALVVAVVLAVGAAVVTVAVSRGAGAPAARLDAAVDVPTPRATGSVGSGAGSAATPNAASTPAGSTPEASAEASILVHVVGAVRHPGLVHLASGARLEDAVEAAGGPTSSAELDAVNLAGVVADGQQVRIPRQGEAAAPAAEASDTDAGGGASQTPASTGAPVDLNTADAAALDALPGIGPVLAQRIVDRRTQGGPFTSVDQLDEVSGIGPALLARLRDLVRV
ncbi:helix-hairpin-helix domain-containing protein [Luteimicrobium sp. DT211]|uniref:helix-hairpin-helix domain-containing protein n=1 Tax=Luteimicrobium sp. DT211 TaxID=3393412 RepID=UPI003CF6CCC6